MSLVPVSLVPRLPGGKQLETDLPNRDEPKGSGLIGTTVSHYEIRGEIGRGGMGVVYRAHDTSLNRTVALKFLPRTLHGDETAHKRFIAEAQTASGLDHPNICTIYEIGETDDGATFIAMAYYPGETLQEKIAKGPLDPDEALSYAIQIARGLAKAHDAGITHRDMKPANCIVTEDGILKILDFGLARVEDQQLTRTGELLGTLSYMAPEQVEGTTADARSDVWSAGAMYYEMLTGKAPFPGANQAAVLYAVMHTEPDELTDANDSVSPDTARLVSRCLKKDQTRRFADAGQLLEALERLRQPAMRGVAPAGGPAPTPKQPEQSASTKPGRGLLWSGLAAAAIAVALLIPGVRSAIFEALSPSEAVASTSRLLAVIPSALGSEDDQILAEGLALDLTWELARLGGTADSIAVVAATDILNLPVRTTPAIRELYPVSEVISIAVLGAPRPRVTFTLTNASSGSQVQAIDLPVPRDATYEAFQDSVPGALAFLLGLEAGTVSTPSWTTQAAAYDYYTRGRGYLARYDDLNNLGTAVTLFEQAVAEDPAYARAYAGLCETRFEQYRFTNDTTYVAQGRDACEAARANGDDEVDVLVSVAGAYLASGDPESAIETLDAALAQDPDNAEVHRWRGRALMVQGDTDAALSAFDDAHGANPGNPIYLNHRGELLGYVGEAAESEAHFNEALRLAPDNIVSAILLSGTYIWSNRLAAADSLLMSLRSRTSHPRIFSNLAFSYWLQGRFNDAAEVAAEGLDDYPRDFWLLRMLAQAQAETGQAVAAEGSWRAIVDVVPPLLAINPYFDDARGALAEAYAKLGERDLAIEQLEYMSAEPIAYNYNVFYVGRTWELLGDREAALGRLGEAVDRGFSIGLVERDPWLEELRADPRFQQSVN